MHKQKQAQALHRVFKRERECVKEQESGCVCDIGATTVRLKQYNRSKLNQRRDTKNIRKLRQEQQQQQMRELKE